MAQPKVIYYENPQKSNRNVRGCHEFDANSRYSMQPFSLLGRIYSCIYSGAPKPGEGVICMAKSDFGQAIMEVC